MLDVFSTNKYDSKIAVVDSSKSYTFLEIKNKIASKMAFIKNENENAVILPDDNFNFLINFFASVFCKKNIYLLSDKKRLDSLNFPHFILNSETSNSNVSFNYPDIDYKNININFYTSGSTGAPKAISASLYNLILEAKDIYEEVNLKNNFTMLSATTNLCHRYGLVTHLLLSFFAKITFDTRNISYPDELNNDDLIFVTTPTFLNSTQKHNNKFQINPKIIFSAGSKLEDDTYKHFEQNSKVVEIYGSTETGDIAYRKSYKKNLKPFFGVKITPDINSVIIESSYIKDNKRRINDNIEIVNNTLIFKARTDRLYKICEKRISADELEEELKKNSFVKDAFILKQNDKLACLCALTKTGKGFLLKCGIPNLTKKLKQYLLNKSEIVPQRWKYIDELPMNSFGKKYKKLIDYIFNTNLSLPVILNRSIAENSIDYEIFFYKECDFFKGHFPNFNILPGVVQLYFAKEFANAHFNLSIGQGQWKRIKFSNIIKAGSIVNLKIEKNDKSVLFEYYSGDNKYSQGAFPLKNIFSEAGYEKN